MSLLTRPTVDTAPQRAVLRSPVLVGLLAALQAAVAGLLFLVVPAMVAWMTAARVSVGWPQAVRVGTDLWLVAHGALLALPSGRVSVMPLGLGLPLLWLCWAGGRRILDAVTLALDDEHKPEPGPRVALLVAGLSFVIGYVVLVVAAAALVGSPDARVPLGSAAVSAAGVAATGLIVATYPRWRPDSALWQRLTLVWRAAWVALVAWFGAAAVFLALAIALGWSRIVAVQSALHPGVVGHLVLVLLQVTLVPTALVWTAGWVAGPGFAVGGGTWVMPGQTELAPMPAVPLLGALPEPGSSGTWWVPLLVGLAGATAGYWLRTRTAARTLRVLIADVVLVAVAVAVAGAVLTWLSSGAAGPGRLGTVGGSWSRVGLIVFVEILIGALIGALAGPSIASGRAGRAAGRGLAGAAVRARDLGVEGKAWAGRAGRRLPDPHREKLRRIVESITRRRDRDRGR